MVLMLLLKHAFMILQSSMHGRVDIQRNPLIYKLCQKSLTLSNVNIYPYNQLEGLAIFLKQGSPTPGFIFSLSRSILKHLTIEVQ